MTMQPPKRATSLTGRLWTGGKAFAVRGSTGPLMRTRLRSEIRSAREQGSAPCLTIEKVNSNPRQRMPAPNPKVRGDRKEVITKQ
jgi:hypothetical protein